MSTSATGEADIRRRIDEAVAAIRAMDLEALMPIYAADIVSFDVEPPLKHLGAEAKRRNWTKVFTLYQRPLGYEVRDLTITAGPDVAFVRSLARLSGTMKGGQSTGYWVRWTTGWRKIEGRWLIVHDQVSVPVDFASGKALLDLQP
jgi:ketosteroid isomerase-like protein